MIDKKLKATPSILMAFVNMQTGKFGETKQTFIDNINREDAYLETEQMRLGKVFHSFTDGDYKKITPVNGLYQVAKYNFKASVVDEVGSFRAGYSHEKNTSRDIITNFGLVHLHGRIDDVHLLQLADLKTCESYTMEKFRNRLQWKIYLYCSKSIKFTYIITDFVNVYYEEYFWYPEIEDELRDIAEQYYQFILDHQQIIKIEYCFL